MANITFAPARAGLRDRVAAYLDTLRAERARRREYARVYGELARMTDRDLADIGISRVSIEDVAVEAAYGRA